MMEQLRRRLFRSVQPLPTKQTLESAWAESKLYRETIPKYSPDDLVGQKGALIYDQMLRDEQVKAVIKFKRDAITARNFSFECDDRHRNSIGAKESDRRIDMYTEMVDKVEGSFVDGLNQIMKAAWQGFSLTEKILHTFDFENEPYIGLKKLSPKPFHTFEFFVDEFGQIIRIEQHNDSERQTIDLSKFVYYVHNPDRDQHYGQSDLREAYRSWYSKDIIIRFYNIFMERMASGFISMKPANGMTIQANSEEYKSLKAILEHMQSSTGILLPAGVELDVHSPVSTDQFEKAVSMHDLQIAKALLVPNLLGISHTGNTGSYSQSETQLEAFLWTLDADALRLQEAINEQIFNPISRMNFADGIGPKFIFKPVSSSKKHEIIKVWLDLVSSGAVEASITDEDHIRKLMDFPEKGEPLDLNIQTHNPDVTDPNASPRSDRPTDGEPRSEGDRFTRISSKAAFSRATKRVAMAVIDRKSNELVEKHSGLIAERLAEMVAGVALDILENNIGTPGSSKLPHQISFNAKERTKLKKAVDAALKAGWDLGEKHAKDEIAKARGEMFKVNMARLGDNAEEFLKTNGFLIVGDMSDTVLQYVAAILTASLKYSWTPQEVVRKVYDRLTVEGLVFIQQNAEVTGRTVSEIQEALATSRGDSLHRIKTTVRTNLFEAMNEARYSIFTDPELDGFVEALEYSAILDSRTTPICRHLDDRVYPVDAPEWNRYRPPNHFNCRSVLVPVTIIDEDVIGKDSDTGRWSRPPTVLPQKGFGD